jgi:hypothetical protein
MTGWVKVKLDSGVRRNDDGETSAGRSLDFFGGRQQALALQFLAGELAGTADGFGLFARPALGGFFVVAAQLHFPENTLALHLLLEGLERLIDVVVANNYLHEQTFVWGQPKGQDPFEDGG